MTTKDKINDSASRFHERSISPFDRTHEKDPEVIDFLTLFSAYTQGIFFSPVLRSYEFHERTDLLQDAITRVTEKFHQYDPAAGKFTNFFFTILRHAISDSASHKRAKIRNPEHGTIVSLSSEESNEAHHIADKAPPPLDELIRTENGIGDEFQMNPNEILNLSTLNDHERRYLGLRMQGMPPAEIQKTLECGRANTSKMWRQILLKVQASLPYGERSGNHPTLSEREQEVWRLHQEGLATKKIAQEIGLGENNITRMLEKIEFKRAAGAKIDDSGQAR